MSYEGYHEFLCVNGHHSRVDCNAGDPEACPRCGSPMDFWNSVDLTNGQEDDCPYTMPAPKVEIGTEAVTVRVPLYRPAPDSRWRPMRRVE